MTTRRKRRLSSVTIQQKDTKLTLQISEIVQWSNDDMAKKKPAYGCPMSGFRKAAGKREFKSLREGANDEDNHETTVMIHQQLHINLNVKQ